MGARRHGREGAVAPPPLEMLHEVFMRSIYSSYSKTLNRSIICEFSLFY